MKIKNNFKLGLQMEWGDGYIVMNAKTKGGYKNE